MKRLLYLIPLFFLMSLFCCNQNVGQDQYTTENHQSNKNEDLSWLDDKGDYYLVGGDMVYAKDDPRILNAIAESNGDNPESRGLVQNSTKVWPNNVVLYKFKSSFSDSELEVITEVMRYLESVCNIKFKETHNHDMLVFSYSISRAHPNADRGISTVGYTDSWGGNYTALKSPDDFGHVLHEFCHGLGLQHEHQRPRARNYTDFFEQNLKNKSDAKYFVELPSSLVTSYGKYDYDSVMHYEANAFATSGNYTLKRKNGSTELGGDRLSIGDIAALRDLYGIPQSKKVLTGNFLVAGNYALTDEKIIYDSSTMAVYHKNRLLFTNNTGSNAGGWEIDLTNDKLNFVGDFNGDGRDEFIVTSKEKLGILKVYNPYRLDTMFSASNNTFLGGWKLETYNNKILAVGDFDGKDNDDEILISSPWGIGILKYKNGSFQSIVCKPFNTRFGGWNYYRGQELGPYGDFNNNGKLDVIVMSDWGIGILEYNGNDSFNCYLAKPYGTWFNSWNFYRGQKVLAAGNFDGKDGDDLLIQSDWGIGILNYNYSGSFYSKLVKSYNQVHNLWKQDEFDDLDYVRSNSAGYGEYQFLHQIADYDNDEDDDILIGYLNKGSSNTSYLGLLSLNGSSFSAKKVSLGWYPYRYNSLVHDIIETRDFNNNGITDIAFNAIKTNSNSQFNYSELEYSQDSNSFKEINRLLY